MARRKHKTERLEVRLTPAQKDAVRRLAEAAGISRTAVITAAIAAALDTKEVKENGKGPQETGY